jgi:hypothetical protein
MRLTVTARRDGKWWFGQAAEQPNVFTQVRRLEQMRDWIEDAARTVLDPVPAEGFDIMIIPALSDADATAIAETRRLRDLRDQTAAQAAAIMRQTAGRLRAEGYSVRDVAQLIGVSPAAVQKLTPA